MAIPAANPPQSTVWRDGPPKWTYTAWGIVLATVHIALAGFKVGQFQELFEVAWPFYSTLIGITSAAAVIINSLSGSRARAVEAQAAASVDAAAVEALSANPR